MNKRIAIVTGGGSGIGLAIAHKFVEEGVTTIIVGRNELKLKEAVNALGSLGNYKVGDLSDLNAIPTLVKSIIEEHGQIDILINNAGINYKKPFLEVTDEAFFQVINTNLLSVFSISREVARYMAEAGTGSIVNISSMAAQYGIPKVIAYSASKTAIEGMTRAMAVELSPIGIRVNCVAPGFIVTPMTDKALNTDQARKAKVFDRTPMGRMGDPSEIGDTVYYLSSQEASFITGQVICVDGGNSVGF